MKTIFKLFGLKEEDIVRSVRLGSNGISQETESCVTRHHLADFDSEIDAIASLSERESWEHGFEKVKTIQL